MNLDQHGNEYGKLFVGGLHQSTTNESLEKYFSNFGEIEEALVMMDNRTNRSRGFGYVKYKEASSVDDVLSQKQHIIDLKEVDPKRCNINMKGKNRRLLKIFVGGIAISHDEEVIRNFFSQFGQVTEVNLLTSPEKDRHRGFAFVGFKDEAVVKHLISLHYLVIKGKQVEIKAMEPPNLVKSVSTYPSQNKNANPSMNMKNNGIFGRISMKNPLYRTAGWLEWNGMFPQSSGPSDWPTSSIPFTNPNTTFVNSSLTTSYPNHNQMNSNHSLQAMMWPNVGQNSHVDQIGHQNTVSQSQHNIFSSNPSSQIVHHPQPAYTQGLTQNGEMGNSGRNWAMNRLSNQSQNSYFMEQQQNALIHGMNRANGTNWPVTTSNNWSTTLSQSFPNRHTNGQSNLLPNGSTFMHNQNHGGSSSNAFESWSPMNNQLNSISNNSVGTQDHQFNPQSHSNSSYHQNRYWSNNSTNPQYHPQKSLFSDDLSNGYQGNSSQYYYQQSSNPKIPGMSNLRVGNRNGPKHFQSLPQNCGPSGVGGTNSQDPKLCPLSATSDPQMISTQNSANFINNSNSVVPSALLEASKGDANFSSLINRDLTASPNSTSNSSGTSQTATGNNKNNTSSLSPANGNASSNAANSNTNGGQSSSNNSNGILSSNSNNQIPIPSH